MNDTQKETSSRTADKTPIDDDLFPQEAHRTDAEAGVELQREQ